MSNSHWLEVEVTEIGLRLDSVERKVRTARDTNIAERVETLEESVKELLATAQRQQHALEELSDWYAECNPTEQEEDEG